ncbi:hypothetical protein [Halocynthiibacter styelae]|uniref:Uncharacterized protein n=1 Tax=Halocynthiibacter styelae TaxID=2761955 RepID=A0A8J7LTS0_9RHOB|nr:hypothetical protein [Paenihalocynthiibacter styelae]MBI1492127.1 hypothetical protein [Paenihalocynthiibacter styelae]
MTNTVILVIGDVNNWLARGHSLPQDKSLVFVDYAAFSAETLLMHRPDMILSPLTSVGFDALDLADRLQTFRYCGAFRVLAPKLPDQAMVTRELCYRAPDVDCELVELNRAPELRVV